MNIVILNGHPNKHNSVSPNENRKNVVIWELILHFQYISNTVRLLAKGSLKSKADFSLIVSFAPRLSPPLQIRQYFESGILFIANLQIVEERVWGRRRQSEKNQLLISMNPLLIILQYTL